LARVGADGGLSYVGQSGEAANTGVLRKTKATSCGMPNQSSVRWSSYSSRGNKTIIHRFFVAGVAAIVVGGHLD